MSLRSLSPTLPPSPACPYANDWSLNCCCNSVQLQVVIATSVYTVLVLLLWEFKVLLPLKLIVLALREMITVIATWITCGKVESVHVDGINGGVTKSTGGNAAFVGLARHFGLAFWGMIFVISASDFIGVQVVAGLFSIGLLLSLVVAKNVALVGLILLFLALIASFWACTILTTFNGLRFIVLLLGVMANLYAVYDLVWPEKLKQGGPALLNSVFWALLSVFFLGLGVYLSLVVGSNPAQK